MADQTSIQAGFPHHTLAPEQSLVVQSKTTTHHPLHWVHESLTSRCKMLHIWHKFFNSKKRYSASISLSVENVELLNFADPPKSTRTSLFHEIMTNLQSGLDNIDQIQRNHGSTSMPASTAYTISHLFTAVCPAISQTMLKCSHFSSLLILGSRCSSSSPNISATQSSS